jgi:hypothetical protein
MMIKGDREPGHLPSEDFMAQMGKYNEELSKAGVPSGSRHASLERGGRSGQVLRTRRLAWAAGRSRG